MKKTLFASLASFALLVHAAVFAGTQDCQTRANAIQTQLDAAQRFGNTSQAARLKAALAQVQAHCTDAGQAARAERKLHDRQLDVQKARSEVRQAQERMKAAQVSGDARKIAKAQRKLADKQDKLLKAMDELRAAQADLAALKG
ncbi:DUF1090 domain-containing protein [Burkholderia multivorans]|uniref:DUF1090 domain-containing protein n=1 Tax=Burkholderia multivorans TaxID=87883 RepID=UPI0004F8F959|nr:DUF1090 domain-containing protein [Burkholderia multivorans]AIO73740.1 hypothetical protein DM80_3361 [Burkholderia multivorans]AOK65070.1 hypothetical protein WM33_05665 [Burkholderia multivorans]KVZ84953.1 hypothetical protein WL23_04330 [Burkholderia multivorans]MBU9386195.1 DUF1090 domain-containing protein [Burkholderia multivorans]MBU9441754.1 DUF1090 domain-containing protein [Burkholderia multivorans]